MNWYKEIILKTIFVLPFFFLAGCPFGKDDPSVSAFLISTLAGSTISTSPSPDISVIGGSSADLSVDFKDETFGSSRVEIFLSGLDRTRAYIFEVSQNGRLDPLITFPIALSTTPNPNIPAMPVGTMAAIYTLASGKGVTVNSSLSVVMGQLSSSGTGCAPIQSVSLQSLTGAAITTLNGPFYFSPQGALVSNLFADPECNYVFFNIPEGNYNLKFLSGVSSTVSEVAVTALAGKVSFGLNIP